MTIDVDVFTKDLGKTIAENTIRSLDNRKTVNEAGAISRAFSTVGNAALSALGNGSARGRLKQNRAAGDLMDKWKEFTAIGKKPWTFDNVRIFLGRTFGQQSADLLIQQLNKSTKNAFPAKQANQKQSGSVPNVTNSSAPNATQQNTPTSPNPPQQEFTNPNISQYFELSDAALKSDKPNKTQVMSNVEKILTMSKGNPNDFKMAIGKLKAMQSQFGDKIPELKTIDFSKFQESRRPVRNNFIFEADPVSSQQAPQQTTPQPAQSAQTNASAPKQPAAPSPTPASSASNTTNNPQRILSKKEVYDIFNLVAVIALDSGAMRVKDPRWTQKMRQLFGAATTDDDDDHQSDYQHYQQTAPADKFDPENSTVDINKLLSNLRAATSKKTVDNATAQTIMSLARKSPDQSIADLLDALHKANISGNNWAAAQAIMMSHAA